MKYLKLFTITFFIIFSSLTGITYAESLKFDASTYEGEVKKGNAHGVGIFAFSFMTSLVFLSIFIMNAPYLNFPS